MDDYEFVNVIGSTGKCLGLSAFKCFGSEFSYVAPGVVDLLDPEEMWQNIQPCKDEFMTLIIIIIIIIIYFFLCNLSVDLQDKYYIYTHWLEATQYITY